MHDAQVVRAEVERRIRERGSLAAVARELAVSRTTLASVAAGFARRGSYALIAERLAVAKKDPR